MIHAGGQVLDPLHLALLMPGGLGPDLKELGAMNSGEFCRPAKGNIEGSGVAVYIFINYQKKAGDD